MKTTIKRLAEHITGQAAALGIEADALDGDSGIKGAECVLHLRDCQHALNHALDALRLAIAQRADRTGEADDLFADDDAA